MAQITAKMVADLRTKTGCGMMDCKKALNESNGDMDEAVKILREKGLSVAAKKATRVAAEGIVDIMTSEDGKTVAMIEVNAETDFVAKNATFQAFVRGILEVIIKNRPATVEELGDLPYDESFTVEGKRKDMVFTIGENMTIRRFVVVDGVTSTYIHGKGTTGVVVKFSVSDEAAGTEAFSEFSKNIALQIAAGNPPTYVSRDQIPASAVEEELNVQIAAAKNDEKLANKPEPVLKKIVEGKMGKLFYERVCLLEQPYVKDDSISVGQYIKNTSKELGSEIGVEGFWLYEKGEGLEKREDDFAAEIESLVKGK